MRLQRSTAIVAARARPTCCCVGGLDDAAFTDLFAAGIGRLRTALERGRGGAAVFYTPLYLAWLVSLLEAEHAEVQGLAAPLDPRARGAEPSRRRRHCSC